MKLTGAQIIMECLLEQHVDTVFGYPGGAILNVYDALYEYKDQITHVLTSHEQGASHAADGSIIFVPRMNKVLPMRQTVMPVPAEKQAFVLLHQARELPIW